MKVTLIAHTVPLLGAMEELTGHAWEAQLGASTLDILSEWAGRSCYQSWTKPNPATRKNKDYHANVLSQGHLSIYEHVSFTFYVEGVSRALTHELIRHRHLSYSQLSQRFVNEDREDNLVLPPAAQGDEEAEQMHLDAHNFSHEVYEALVDNYIEKGLTRKQAREAARAVLPNQQETKLVITGNVRAWRDVILKRNDPSADAEIQKFAGRVLGIIRAYAPNSVQDLDYMEAIYG